MALTKEVKQRRMESLREQLSGAQTIILAGFSGMTVEQDLELRRRVRETGARYRVIKNTLAEKAAQGTPAEPVLQSLQGVCSIAFTSGDGVALAKALQKYAKENPALVVKAGVVEGTVINAAGVDQLAATPSKEELYARLLFLIQAPAQRLVTVLGAVGRNTAVVVDQAVKGKKFAE